MTKAHPPANGIMCEEGLPLLSDPSTPSVTPCPIQSDKDYLEHAAQIAEATENSAQNLYPASLCAASLKRGDLFADDRYSVREKLGEGTNGSVYRVLDIKEQRYVALKVFESHSTAIHPDLCCVEKYVPKTAKEFNAFHKGLREIEHRNTMFSVALDEVASSVYIDLKCTLQCVMPVGPRIYTIGLDGNILFMTMELFHYDLRKYLTLYNHSLDDLTRHMILEQSFRLLRDLHELGMLHRDVKLSNMLVLTGENNKPVKLVLADFATSQCFQNFEEDTQHYLHPSYERHQTPDTAPPEMFLPVTDPEKGERPCEASEVFSMAMALTGIFFDFALPMNSHRRGKLRPATCKHTPECNASKMLCVRPNDLKHHVEHDIPLYCETERSVFEHLYYFLGDTQANQRMPPEMRAAWDRHGFVPMDNGFSIRSLPHGYQSLFERLLEWNPMNRLTARQALQELSVLRSIDSPSRTNGRKLERMK